MPVEVHPLTLRQTWEAVRTNRPLLVLCASTLVVPLAPRLSARFGVRPTYVGMAVVAAVGALGIALAPTSVPFVMACFALQELGSAPINALMSALVVLVAMVPGVLILAGGLAILAFGRSGVE